MRKTEPSSWLLLFAVHRGRERFVHDEALEEPAALSVGEQGGDEVRLRVAGAEALRRVIGEGDLGELDLVERDAALHAVEGRRRHRPPRHLGAARQVAEERLDERPDLLRVEVARHDEARVGRRVERREEVLHVVHLRRLEVLLRADRREVVRVRGGVEQVLDGELGAAVGLVLVALPQLVQDDVPLQVQLLLVHGPREVLEPVGVEPQQSGQEGGRAGGEVIRPVGGRRRVVRAARGLHEPVEVAVRDSFRSHEHQMLEKMRESAPVRKFVLAAHAVPEVDGGDRKGVVRIEDHGHSVFQREFFDGKALRGSGGGEDEDKGEGDREYASIHAC